MSQTMSSLSEFSLFIRNGASIKQTDGASGDPITRIETIANRTVNLAKCGYADVSSENYSNYLLKKGDILISHINSTKHLGKCAIYEGDEVNVIHGMNLLCLRVDEAHAYPKYVFYMLSSSDFLRQLPKITKNSVNQSSFNVKSFQDLKIPLPPLETQKQIAAVLEKADQLRKDCQQMEQELNSLAQSVFIDMFGDPVTNPKGWEVKTLDDVCDDIYRYPTFYGYDYVDKGIPVVKIGNITADGYVDGDLSKYDFMPESISKEYPRTILKLGDIVMAVRGDGSTGKRIGLVESESVVNGNISPNLIMYRANLEKVDYVFLYFFLTSFGGQKKIEKYISKTAKKTITGKDIKKIEIYCPPMELQNEFKAVYLEVRGMIKNASTTEDYDALFNSLFQKAFKGELNL